MTTEKTRIMICDDHEVVREGLRGLISRQESMTVVGEAGTVAEAIEAAARSKPDVVIMDVRLPDGSGVEACRAIRDARSETRVIMLTSYADDEALFASIIAGASGYLLKDTPPGELLAGIRIIAAGEALLAPSITKHLIEEFVRRPEPGHLGDAELDGLTEREIEQEDHDQRDERERSQKLADRFTRPARLKAGVAPLAREEDG